MTSNEKIKELKETMTNEEIKNYAKEQMDKYWGKDNKWHNFWMRVFNNV